MDGRKAVVPEPVTAGADGDGFWHCAFFYRSEAEYLGEVSAFVQDALARGDPVLVMVPGACARPLRNRLGASARHVAFADMAELGRNPARIIPAVRAFASRHLAGRISCVAEPAWPGRSRAELAEAVRHEALVNLAFASTPMTALCPYDVIALPAGVLAAAQQAHPVLARPGSAGDSPAYLGPEGTPPACQQPLPDPPAQAETLRFRTDLQPVRDLMGWWAAGAGMGPDRAADLVLAVSELAANTLCHTSGNGLVRIWQAPGELVCEIQDRGTIADPLAGRTAPAGDAAGGLGLWVVNQLCDLVETRTGSSGTTIRLHMRLPQ